MLPWAVGPNCNMLERIDLRTSSSGGHGRQVVNDVEQPESEQTKSDAEGQTIKSGSVHPCEPTEVLDEQVLAQTIPSVNESSVDSDSDVETANFERERVPYFGDYELLEEVARGGMGVVYRAQQTRLKRIVAVKMILGGQLASEKDVRRFLVEAEAAANLDHPGIVPVYEFGEHSGTHFFSMAFVDGPSLAERAGEQPLPTDEATELIIKVAEAVAYAHRRGVVHRDLKPANVLIDLDGQPRITDFGLAKRIDADDELTQDGTIMGSVFYMPPEQAAGKTALIGPAADIYALGAILYKLLTGHPPFQAPTTMEILKQVVDQEPIPPRRVNPRIPRDLETICLKCLQKDISRRFASADELVEELERLKRGEPIRSRPISRWAHVWRWCCRNPLPAALAAGLCAAVLFGTITATTLLNRARAEQRRFEQQQRTAEVLSEMVLRKTLDETDEWLRLFFQPVEQQLVVTRDWALDGVFDTEQPEKVNQLLGPLIRHYPQISSLMIADDRGREHMLLCITQEHDGTIDRQWKCRQTRRDIWQGQVQWLEWTDDRHNVEKRTEQLQYDPRTRPWFKGAISKSAVNSQSPTDRIHWTEPYVFFTTKDLGITASTALPDTEGGSVTSVVAFDVLLEDITRFTNQKYPTPNGKVVVLTEDAALVGLPGDRRLATPEQWKQLFLKPLVAVDQPFASDAARTFSLVVEEGTQIRSFQTGGSTWWGAAKPFQLGDTLTLWILVLLPESDLHDRLSED